MKGLLITDSILRDVQLPGWHVHVPDHKRARGYDVPAIPWGDSDTVLIALGSNDLMGDEAETVILQHLLEAAWDVSIKFADNPVQP